MRKILVDTSSIIFALSNKIDLFAIVEERLDSTAVISSGVVRELKGLSERRNKEGRAAKLALQILSKHKIDVIENEGPVDDFLFDTAILRQMSVCTNDSGLKRRLRRRGIRPLSVSRSGVLR